MSRFNETMLTINAKSPDCDERKATWQKLWSIEERMNRFFELHGTRTKAESYLDSQKSTQKPDAMHKQWYDWVRSARRRNTGVTVDDLKAGSSSNGGTRMDQTIKIEIIPFPVYDGKLENWASFRRVFRETVKESRQGPVLEMARLKSAVPEKAWELLEGVMESEEAWERLYGVWGQVVGN